MPKLKRARKMRVHAALLASKPSKPPMKQVDGGNVSAGGDKTKGTSAARRMSKKAILVARAKAAKDLEAAAAPKSWKPSKSNQLLEMGTLTDFLPGFPNAASVIDDKQAKTSGTSASHAVSSALDDVIQPEVSKPAPAAPKPLSHVPKTHAARRRALPAELSRLNAVLALPVFGSNPVGAVTAHLQNSLSHGK